MPYILDNVREASYKEAVFIVENSSVSGGRKDVIHEFVNSDKQVVEDLGLLRKTYNLTAIIHGNNYEQEKNALLRVLQDGKKGTLVHPFDGNVINMAVRTFSVSESFDNFGIATFNIVLVPSDDISAPSKVSTSVSEVASQRNLTLDAISEVFEELYETSADLTGSIENSIEKATDFINEFEVATSGFDGISSLLNSLSASILDFNSSVAALVQNPVELAESITELFTIANNAYPSAVQTLGLMENLFNFGSNDTEQLNVSTAAVNEINSNNDVFNYSINSYALANAYFQIADSDFNTINDIERQESILEDQYDLITNITDLPQIIRMELTTLRSIASEVINELKTTTPDLIEIELINTISIRKLEYLYYANNERTETLISINQLQDIGFVDGALELLNDNV